MLPPLEKVFVQVVIGLCGFCVDVLCVIQYGCVSSKVDVIFIMSMGEWVLSLKCVSV